ncbi:MAG: signal peptidase II [Lachnospiraceae bacterium]|nr:signal peptidase II [Lachnospiraceae bacterium]
MLKRYGIFGLLSAIAIAIDQWSKALAFENLRGRGPIVLIPGIFELLYSENRGAAFGILQGKKLFFFLVGVFVISVVLLFLAKLPGERRFLPLYLCMVLLASGAAGNLIDRAMRGFVVDFFYFSLIDFPIFNVADCYVVTAAGFIILLTGFFYKEEELAFLSKKEKA